MLGVSFPNPAPQKCHCLRLKKRNGNPNALAPPLSTCTSPLPPPPPPSSYHTQCQSIRILLNAVESRGILNIVELIRSMSTSAKLRSFLKSIDQRLMLLLMAKIDHVITVLQKPKLVVEIQSSLTFKLHMRIVSLRKAS